MTPTIADELLIQSLSQEVRDAILRIFGTEEAHAEEMEAYRREIRSEMRAEVRDAIRDWNSRQEPDVGLSPKTEHDLIDFVC